jgi:hypothetical protein
VSDLHHSEQTQEPGVEHEPASEARDPASPRWRNIAIIVIAFVLVAIAVIAALMLGQDDDLGPVFQQRTDPVENLLGWLPANGETLQTFAVWTDDPGLATPVSGTTAARLQDQLSLEPVPLTLGRSAAWQEQFGWSIDQVSGWATAGRRADVAILSGDFDRDLIEPRLTRSGYNHETYRGVDLFVLSATATPGAVLNGDAGSAANAIVVTGEIIATSSDPERVRAAVDAAIDGGSVMDVPTITGMVRTMSPINGLVAVNQAILAQTCDPNATEVSTSEAANSNFVMVGYGRVGSGGDRRTMVAVSFPDESSAIAASPDFERGWIDGFANAGGTGGSIAAYGRLTVVTRTERYLVAELVEGRDDGWVRAGIRYAIPVCEAAIDLVAQATPVSVDD